MDTERGTRAAPPPGEPLAPLTAPCARKRVSSGPTDRKPGTKTVSVRMMRKSSSGDPARTDRTRHIVRSPGHALQRKFEGIQKYNVRELLAFSRKFSRTHAHSFPSTPTVIIEWEPPCSGIESRVSPAGGVGSAGAPCSLAARRRRAAAGPASGSARGRRRRGAARRRARPGTGTAAPAATRRRAGSAGCATRPAPGPPRPETLKRRPHSHRRRSHHTPASDRGELPFMRLQSVSQDERRSKSSEEIVFYIPRKVK